MSASPLVLVYNVPGTYVLHNYFVDASGSPLPGFSTVALFTVQSKSDPTRCKTFPPIVQQYHYP